MTYATENCFSFLFLNFFFNRTKALYSIAAGCREEDGEDGRSLRSPCLPSSDAQSQLALVLKQMHPLSLRLHQAGFMALAARVPGQKQRLHKVNTQQFLVLRTAHACSHVTRVPSGNSSRSFEQEAPGFHLHLTSELSRHNLESALPR